MDIDHDCAEMKLAAVELLVTAAEAGLRLDVFLARRFGRSRQAVQQRLSGQVCNQDGQVLKWSYRLACGMKIKIAKLEHPEPQVPVSYKVLYEDEWLLAVDKGPGAPVHPTRSFKRRTILTYLRKQYDQPQLSPVHRLDRETSGVLVFGRNKSAINEMGRQFAAGLVKKRYLAVVWGQVAFDQKVLAAPLGRDEDFPIRCRMRVDRQAGQEALTEFEVVERFGDRTLLAAIPKSGRMHQIRVHAAELGHPLLGDKLYQDEGRPYLAMITDSLQPADYERLGHLRHALHAEQLLLTHPASGKPLHLFAPLPEDLCGLLHPPKDKS